MSPGHGALLREGPATVLLVGMGLANRAVAGALLRRGHSVIAADDAPDEELRGALVDLGIALVDEPDDLGRHLAGVSLVVPAPGLPEHHPVFAAAAAAQVPIVGELDLAAVWDERPLHHTMVARWVFLLPDIPLH